MLSLHALLNPVESQASVPSQPHSPAVSERIDSRPLDPSLNVLFDVQPQLKSLLRLTTSQDSVFAPRDVKKALDIAVRYFSEADSQVPESLPTSPHWPRTTSSCSSSPPATPSSLPHQVQSIQHNVDVTRRITLDRLYTYERGAFLEYPETNSTGRIGHLFTLDPSDWSNPVNNFVYSQGEPKGADGRGTFCDVLVDGNGHKVPCRISHSTCQGCKVCPYADFSVLQQPHCEASREDLRLALERARQSRRNRDSPEQDLFKKTLSLWAAFKKYGCRAPIHEETTYSSYEGEAHERWVVQTEKARRGHDVKPTCDGRILFGYNDSGKAFVHCEHYHAKVNTDHLIDFDVGNGLYDTEYLEALFNGDMDDIEEIECNANAVFNAGPQASCSTISNFGSIKVNCPCEHRNAQDELVIAEMVQLPCKSRIRVFEPLPDYREVCPQILVICSGEHTHPIPLPTKTPTAIRTQIFDLLGSIDQDLADLTPRCFLRHPTLCAYLRQHLPHIKNPTLSDLHISLANRDHLRSYILQAKANLFPLGTGWEGLLRMKKVQDETLAPEEAYIRYASEIPLHSMPVHEEDEVGDTAGDPLRIIICMGKDGSRRLLRAQYLQSDIGFKRIVGFHEFELGAMERDARTSLVYCRIYLTRQTAAAHHLIFKKIEEIVREDTGQSLRWRHLHASNVDDFSGILHWAADQHGGQAKGLGLHLKELALQLPDRHDLHEPQRVLSSLTEYEHLHRIFRLCYTHFMRNIKTTAVTEPVKNLMRSLVCIEHRDFKGTLREIEQLGGKAGTDWVRDKTRSKFAFEGICWAKSHIPKAIWQAGDATSNIIESLHSDVNREGISCTLVGGIKKGHHLDNLKLKTLKAYEDAGIRPSYRRNHISENTSKNLKRKGDSRHKSLAAADNKIDMQNKKLKTTQIAMDKARDGLQRAQYEAVNKSHSNAKVLETVQKATRAAEKASANYTKAVGSSLDIIGTGSGKVGLLLPLDVVHERVNN